MTCFIFRVVKVVEVNFHRGLFRYECEELTAQYITLFKGISNLKDLKGAQHNYGIANVSVIEYVYYVNLGFSSSVTLDYYY